MRTGKLTARTVDSILGGRGEKRYHGDGAGLWLVISRRDDDGKPQAASWVYRYMLDGINHEVGLGSVWDVSLAEAREAARNARRRVRVDKIDVLAERREQDRQRRDRARIQANQVTFKRCAEELIALKEEGWRNPVHRYQWRATLETYAYPILGNLPPAAIDTDHVVRVLKPIWTTKPETASRLRGRIEAVLNYAIVNKLRDGPNPARWKDHLEFLLPRRSAIAPVEHHAALPYRDIGRFVSELRQQKGTAAKALEFLILTWARTGEVIGCRWDEINIAERLWIIPAERMKAGKEHRVPLSDRAVEIIAEMQKVREQRPSEYVFPGLKPGESLSNMAMLSLLRRIDHPELTVHGFRSCARDWAAEKTDAPSDMCELALAHTVSSKVEAAYRRGDMFEKRRVLAEAWSRWCDGIVTNNCNIIAVFGAAAAA